MNKGAKNQGAGVMRVSSFDRSNWAKMASAAKGAGLESVAKKFGAAASLPVGEEIPVTVFDQLQKEWRDWLVAGFRKPVAKDLITELREALDDLLGQADLGEVDEETAPIVERAKAALKRAEREESELIAAVRTYIVARNDGGISHADFSSIANDALRAVWAKVGGKL